MWAHMYRKIQQTDLESGEQRCIREVLQHNAMIEVDDHRIEALSQRVQEQRRWVHTTMPATSGWDTIWAGLDLRPLGMGLAVAVCLLCIVLYSPSPDSDMPLVEMPQSDENPIETVDTEMIFYLEEHTLASGPKALDPGYVITSILLNEL